YSDYYAEVRKHFGTRWLLRDGNGIVIGPDVGLLLSVSEARHLFSHALNFWDIGAGTGELSHYLVRVGAVRQLLVNEASPHLQSHLTDLLLPTSPSTQVEFRFAPAVELDLPDKADLVALGIYYGAQPPFLEKSGAALARALGQNGVLLVQSGMVEGRFNLAS